MLRFVPTPHFRRMLLVLTLLAGALLIVGLVQSVRAQTPAASPGPGAGAGTVAAPGPAANPGEEVKQKGFLDFITAGGVVGYVIIALSFFSAGLVIDSFIYLRQIKLMPPGIVEQAEALARKGRFSEIQTLCKAGDSLISRILEAGMNQGSLGVLAMRQGMQEQGVKEFAKLNQRVGYMGFIGSIGPMLGLLGTVLGMVNSFHVLGSSKGAARADELAQGIAYALVTTCEGLVVAIPMMFFHNFFRDRLTKISTDCSSFCERFVRVATAVMEARLRARPMPAAPAPQAAYAPAVAAAPSFNGPPDAMGMTPMGGQGLPTSHASSSAMDILAGSGL